MGNKHGMFTVLVDPFNREVENFAVRSARKFEDFMLAGPLRDMKPLEHSLVSYDQLKELKRDI